MLKQNYIQKNYKKNVLKKPNLEFQFIEFRRFMVNGPKKIITQYLLHLHIIFQGQKK